MKTFVIPAAEESTSSQEVYDDLKNSDVKVGDITDSMIIECEDTLN